MKPLLPIAAIGLAACLLAPPVALAAGDDHGHDHGAAAPAASVALPRFAAVSDLFELVGVLKGKHITLYLDRSADNSPVTDARIELEIAGKKFIALPRKGLPGLDEFEIVLPEAPQPGVLPITATVSAGAEVDLLVGELDIHTPALAQAPAHVHSRWEYAGWAALALTMLTALIIGARRVLSSRQARLGGAA